jgi:UDP-2,3-diacylglucosamine pyrophosphatase LpxH
MRKLKVKTVILSDVHLGTPNCKIREVNHFLKFTQCRKLILNGDIIDGWKLKRSGGWTKGHTRFVRRVLKKMEKKDTEVIYLRGNHDDILGKFLPLDFETLHVVEEHVHVTPNGRYLVLHGDVFDLVTTKMPILSHIGDVGYNLLLGLNRAYNHWRSWRGKEYFSLSAAIKAKVKKAVNFVSSFEDHIVDIAKRRNCTGVICGHIHTAADKMLGDIHYLNSGDWVESLTAIVEHEDGRFELIRFSDFVLQFPMEEHEGEIAEAATPDAMPAEVAAVTGQTGP